MDTAQDRAATPGSNAPAANVPDLTGILDAIQPWQEELYRDLHRHPELSMAETRTRQVIAARLAALGYQVLQIGGGVVGILRNTRARPSCSGRTWMRFR